MTAARRAWPGRGTMWAALMAIFAVLLLALVVSESSRLVGHSFPGFLVWDNGLLASFHEERWTGVQAGLPRHGRVVEVSGRPFGGGAALLDEAVRLGPGASVVYGVRHGSQVSTYSVPTMVLTWGGYLSTFGVYLGNAAVLFLVAIVAMLLRPDQVAARAVAISSCTLAVLLVLSLDFLVSYRLTVLYPLVEALMPAALAYLALSFPLAVPMGGERGSIPRRLRWVMPVVLPCLLATGVAQVVLFRTNPDLHIRITGMIYLLLAAALVGVLGSFGYQLLRSRLPEARMQAGIVFAGAIVSTTPAVVMLAAMFLLGWSFSVTWIVAFVPFLPVSILYAVVYRDMLRAERFIRLTTGYALATAAIVIGYAAILAGFDLLAFSGISRQPAASLGILVALALALDPLRMRVQRAIDRIFFRTDTDIASVLERSSTEFAVRREESAIHRHVQEVLQDALSLEWVELSSDEPREDASITERVQFRGETLGALGCGPKRSGAPFSAAERELVRGIANQAALALQNARTLRALHAAQDDLVRSERFAAIGELSAAVAHGLRNPLAGIRAAAQVAHEVVQDEAASVPLADVLSEVDRLDSRVRTLLDFSRPFEPRLEEADLGEILRVISRGLSTHARARGVNLEIVLPPDEVVVCVDPNHLEEAVQELAGNALRALDSGGTLWLELDVKGSTASIRVRDDGRGIPQAVQDRVFDPFFTTRPEGTGMGLATVRKLIERQGGRVDLERSGPDGTTFRIELAYGTGTDRPLYDSA